MTSSPQKTGRARAAKRPSIAAPCRRVSRTVTRRAVFRPGGSRASGSRPLILSAVARANGDRGPGKCLIDPLVARAALPPGAALFSSRRVYVGGTNVAPASLPDKNSGRTGDTGNFRHLQLWGAVPFSRASRYSEGKIHQMVNQEVVRVLAEVLQQQHGFVNVTQLDKAVADVLRKTQERGASGRTPFSLSTMIRGLRAMRGEAMTPATVEADVAYVKALTTGSTPGSYLVPTIQADEIIGYLSIGGILRASGARIAELSSNADRSKPRPTFVRPERKTSTRGNSQPASRHVSSSF